MWLKGWLVCGLAFLFCYGRSQSVGPAILNPAVSMSQATNNQYFLTQNATLVAPTRGQSPSVTVSFTGAHPAWLYQVLNSPQNWSGTSAAVMTLINYEPFPVTVCVVISSSSNPANLSQSFQAPVTLAPNSTTRYAFAYALPNPLTEGLQALPPPPGAPVNYVFSISRFDQSQVGHWRISYQGTVPATIGLSEFDLATYEPGFPNLVDQYFQWTGSDWATKIHQDSDFQTRLADEETDLANHRNTAELTGSTELPSQASAGKWQVATYRGKKYLVHPSGHLFWMFGLNGVHDAYGTMVSNREQMFESLPPATGSTASLYIYHTASLGPSGTDVFDQRVNLIRKFGQSYEQPFVAQLKQRLPSWGFNTVGAGSFDDVYDGSMPFTKLLDTNAFPTRLSTPTTNWTSLPDPYDPNFQSWLNGTFRSGLAHYLGKSNFAGVFVDNEMSWGTVTSQTPQGTVNCALGALAALSGQPARSAFLAQLEKEYPTISALNSAWGTSYTSFSAMTAPADLGLGLNSAASKDCTAFESAFAATYFSKVRQALQAAGLKSLYLGCRFYTSNDSVVAAAAKYVDVLSFNHYGTAASYPWTYYNELPKPVLISESSVGQNAEGLFAGQPLAPDPNTRAVWAYQILKEAANQPNIVGLDWFNFSDWAATGDGDSEENFGYGVVDVCDTPHQPLVNTFRTFAKQLYFSRNQ